MDSVRTFIVLLGCWTVGSSPGGQPFSFSMVFSAGTRLLVHVSKEVTDRDEEDLFLPLRNDSNGPSIQMLTSVQTSQDPESPRLLVCLLKGLKSPQQPVLWWLDGSVVSAAGFTGPWTESHRGFSTSSVWEVPAADWSPTSSYCCGTVQDGHEYRKKLCSQD